MNVSGVLRSLRRAALGSCALAAATLVFAQHAAAQDKAKASKVLDDVMPCDLSVVQRQDLNDYRTRDLSDHSRWSIADIKKNHLDPANDSMRAGRYGRNVIGDLVFMLNWWPNHYEALDAAVRYTLGGGKSHDFPSTQCLLARARHFAPDDVNVLLIEGNYRWKLKDTKKALAIYQEALALAPESMNAHYNIGLLYADLGNYDKAMEHAKVAYEKGYPLPGLRKKLEAAGRWRPGPVASSSTP